MENIIKAAVERDASDIHIKAGDVFRARIDGKLTPLTKQRLTPEQTKAIALKLIPLEEDRKRIDQIKDYDCSWGAAGIGRFRVNILRQRSSFSIVMRVIPFEVPTVEKLNLPQVLNKIAENERGMILVTGVTGSGKSSTLAAIVNHINQGMNKHIVTLENPIEFLHRDIASSVTQREIGPDTESFGMGLRAALRQDPDVVQIGEMRDAETVDIAMKAAETGHLLISTLHTPDATTTVARIVAMFPPEEQEVVRIRLADSLQAVISQRRRQGAMCGPRGHDRDGDHPRPDPRPEPRGGDQGLHRRREGPVRDAELRSAPDGAGRDRHRDVRGGEGCGVQPLGLRVEAPDLPSPLEGRHQGDHRG
jgi:twitching motility protein PilT